MRTVAQIMDGAVYGDPCTGCGEAGHARPECEHAPTTAITRDEKMVTGDRGIRIVATYPSGEVTEWELTYGEDLGEGTYSPHIVGMRRNGGRWSTWGWRGRSGFPTLDACREWIIRVFAYGAEEGWWSRNAT